MTDPKDTFDPQSIYRSLDELRASVKDQGGTLLALSRTMAHMQGTLESLDNGLARALALEDAHHKLEVRHERISSRQGLIMALLGAIGFIALSSLASLLILLLVQIPAQQGSGKGQDHERSRETPPSSVLRAPIPRLCSAQRSRSSDASGQYLARG